ncbi:hypothetical protein [Shewanella sp.]|uniref:hypothetical protein n=1 Tax=Shewanella sp. TaxID=50422 RepID=UPI003A982CD9
MNPTNPEDELAQGRMALWLTPDDIAFLSNEWRKIPDNVDDETKERWARIAFRAASALHKAGVTYEPEFPKEDQKYRR